ncbi:MAG: hypothetical protein H7232_02315 [Aeromicrobium sp.]|nr:hypothetical protein [Burkholderiales bacterium]
MKLIRNAFTSDTLMLTLRDLFLHAIGKTIGADKALTPAHPVLGPLTNTCNPCAPPHETPRASHLDRLS